jgi:HK97 family phage prohead protease
MSDTPGVAVDAARENGRPPRDELVRAVRVGVDLRRAEGDDEAKAMPTLFGTFTPFNRFTEINSFFEGNFMERIAPGAFKKTFREQTPKVLFQHGSDPQIGDKVLGRAEVLREEADGPYYEVPLLDTSYNRDLVPGLEAGLYGASFRFSVMREEWVDEPAVSDDNPKGLPERTIKEARVSEFGPVTFPAYQDATAGVRSMTDEFLIGRATARPDTLRSILEYLEQRDKRDLHTSAPAEREGTGTTQAEERSVDETARAVIEEAEAGAPGEPTPLYFGKRSTSRKATPGRSSTSLYIPKSKRTRKGWNA